MIRKLHTTLLALLIISSATAQDTLDLVFDSTFYNNAAHVDDNPPDIFFSDYGSFRQFNDSMFIYYRNNNDWNASQVFAHVTVKTIHSNGSISFENIYNLQSFYGQFSPDLYSVTDVVVSNDRVFIISNEAWDENGITRYGIHVESYDFVNGYFEPSTWGNGSIQIANTNIYNAKGVASGNNIVLALNHSTNFRNIATITIGSAMGSISYGPPVLLTDNSSNSMNSDMADIILVSSTEIYIADNAFAYSSSGGATTYTDRARILKYNPSTYSLSSDYNVNGTGVSAYMNWNTQSNTPNTQDFIRSIVYQNGKLLVAGYYNHYDGSQYSLARGRITRLNANGTIDNSFAPSSSISGTSAPEFSNDYFRWSFNDIDLKSDGSIFVSAHGTGGNSPFDPVNCFFLQLDSLGNLDQTIGNEGRLFESQLFGEIRETIIIPGDNPLKDQFVFNGVRVLIPDPINGEYEVAMGRLVWNTAENDTIVDDTLTGLTEKVETTINLYPNPANTIMHVVMSEASPVFIMDILGKTVLSSQLQKGENRIDVSSLKSGVYFLREEQGATLRFIKQ